MIITTTAINAPKMVYFLASPSNWKIISDTKSKIRGRTPKKPMMYRIGKKRLPRVAVPSVLAAFNSNWRKNGIGYQIMAPDTLKIT
mmetsp:Transcript_19809/g.29667  ORF Transcript_19809/g.29667 Transcript_19809/m.29667 type:complete len:86 (+) Transcript_19809:402-659(+)